MSSVLAQRALQRSSLWKIPNRGIVAFTIQQSTRANLNSQQQQQQQQQRSSTILTSSTTTLISLPSISSLSPSLSIPLRSQYNLYSTSPNTSSSSSPSSSTTTTTTTTSTTTATTSEQTGEAAPQIKEEEDKSSTTKDVEIPPKESLFEKMRKKISRDRSKEIDALVDQELEGKLKVVVEPKPPGKLYSALANISRPYPMAKKALDGLTHFLEQQKAGFTLLFYDVSISSGLTWKLMKGDASLTRRERRQLVRTMSDLLRLVPFSVFIIIPFMEFFLPVALKLFPNMLPSTFTDKAEKEKKQAKQLKVKLEMAKVLQDSIGEMTSVKRAKPEDQQHIKIRETYEAILKSDNVSHEEVLDFLKNFKDEITLDNMSRPQIVALCKTIMVPTIGTTPFLRFQLRLKMRQLKADDLIIQKEGINSMTVAELQTACQDRGMRAIGISLGRLRLQLEEWLHLTLREGVPMTMVLVSRALLVSSTPDATAMKSSVLSNVSDQLVSEAELMIKKTRGEIIDNKARLEAIKEEKRRIEEEAAEEKAAEEASAAAEAAAAAEEQKATEEKQKAIQEQEQEQQQQQAVEPAPATNVSFDTMDVKETEKTEPVQEPKEVLKEKAEAISQEELQDIADALTNLSSDSIVANERAELEELLEERAELKQVQEDGSVKQSFASKQLEKKVAKLINKIDKELVKREKGSLASIDADGDGIVTLEELINGAKRRGFEFDEGKLERIANELDMDNDGKLTISEILKILEVLEDEESDITTDDIAKVASLLSKEAALLSDEEKVAAANATAEALKSAIKSESATTESRK